MLLAVSTIGVSTTALSVVGVASAADPVPSLSFSTDEGAVSSGPVPEGICAITWRVIGGEGGVDSNTTAGLPGGELILTTQVGTGDVFTLNAGAMGTTDQAGGPSVVTLAGQAYLSAGGGAVAGGPTATNVGYDKRLSMFPQYDSAQPFGGFGAEGSERTGNGLVEGTGVLCSAPPAPYVGQPDVYVFDDSAVVYFTPLGGPLPGGGPAFDPARGVAFQPADGWEFSLDGTTWTSFDAGGDERRRALSLSGLDIGESYTVSIRATSLVGPGAASAPVVVRPVRTYLAPSEVTVRTGVKSLTVSWTPPADVAGVTGWLVEAVRMVDPGPEAEEPPSSWCETTAADDLDCTLPVAAGSQYAVTVRALAEGDYQGLSGHPAYSDVVPDFVAPATVPTATAPLRLSDADTKVEAGEQVTVRGSGFAPGSSVDIVMYSTPQLLATVEADANGDVATLVTVPAGLASGVHTLLAAGVDADGNPHYLTVEVVVAEDAAPAAADGTGAVLADTGFTALPVLGAGMLALTAGGGLLLVSRRRQT
ncbi:hypothetical protein [Blastococcus sp. SYSU DS0619]